ncbi:hypothetical protein Phpb_04173 [Photorhabdus namnaonensis]|uniref:Uncharacterized protein n=1 Tax=Photorhabdus namnaonensis TaxID=1851568 RepID=A0A1B8YCC3_9GAMM|nr:hypothetical protein Phpb_04173 [Photorhabdus namnaonensis]
MTLILFPAVNWLLNSPERDEGNNLLSEGDNSRGARSILFAEVKLMSFSAEKRILLADKFPPALITIELFASSLPTLDNILLKSSCSLMKEIILPIRLCDNSTALLLSMVISLFAVKVILSLLVKNISRKIIFLPAFSNKSPVASMRLIILLPSWLKYPTVSLLCNFKSALRLITVMFFPLILLCNTSILLAAIIDTSPPEITSPVFNVTASVAKIVMSLLALIILLLLIFPEFKTIFLADNVS